MSGKRRFGRVLGTLLHLGAGLGLLLVFLGGSLLALVLYADLPAGRRLVARGLQRTLTKTFEGSFSIDSVERISLGELRAIGITVRDPDGHVVLIASDLRVQADVPGIVRKLLTTQGELTLRFEHARIERAEVYLLPGKGNVPTIADAFTPIPTPPGTASTSSGPSLKVWFPEVEVGRIYGRMALDGVPTLETELSTVRGSVVGSAEQTSVDVERFSALVRGLGGADARGVGSVHVRVPGAIWTSFDGYFGDVQFGTIVRIDSPKLEVTLDVPRAEPQAVRALWSQYPLLKNVGAHVEGAGTLAAMHTQAKLSIEQATVTSSGQVRLSGQPGADLDVSGRGIDLQSLWASAPRTALDADTTLSVFQSGSDYAANISGSTRATRVRDQDVPALDFMASYNASKGLSGEGTLHEPGAEIATTFAVHPDGSIDATAQAKRVDLRRAPRLAGYFDGRGLLDLQLKARIEQNRLVVTGNGALNQLEYGELSVKSNRFSGRASGPLDAPNRLSLDVSIASQQLRAGAFGFDELTTKLRGPVTRPVVSTTLTSQRGPTITAKASVTPSSTPRIDDLSVEVRRDQAALLAHIAQVDVAGDQVRVRGLSLEGAGGKLAGGGQLGPDRVAISARGEDLDLAVIAHALGLPRGMLAGKVGIDAEVDSNGKVHQGKVSLSLAQGELEGVAVDSLTLNGELNGTRINLVSSAKLRDFGAFSGEIRANVPGSLVEQKSYERATGSVTVKAEHVPFKLLSYVLPKSLGVSEVRGEGSALLVLDRSEPSAIPNLSLIANTSDLFVGLEPSPGQSTGKNFEGVDAHAGLNVNGSTGDTDFTLKLDDHRGPLASATLHSTVDLERATKAPEHLVDQLRDTPLVAKVVIDDRPLEELPLPVRPAGVLGRLRTELSLRGSVNQPVFSDKIELKDVRFGESQHDRALDLCGQLDYDKPSGRFGARGELFLPTETTRPCAGSRVAQFSAGGRAEWAKLVGTVPNSEPAWTGTAGLSLEGVPVDVVPALSEAGLMGRAYGALMFDRKNALPEIRAQLEVREAVVQRTRLGTAHLGAHTDGRALKASLQIEQPASGPAAGSEAGGTLDGSLQSAVNWDGVVPNIDETRPISGSLKAKNVGAAILAPFLEDVLSEISGKLDANLEATLTPTLDANAEEHWTGAAKGSLVLKDGTLQLARLGLRMRNVSLSARADAHDNATLITVDSLSAAAEADRPNVAASGHLWLSGLRASRGNARVTLGGVPFLVEGVTLATLNANDVLIELERKPTEMFVGLTVPELEAKLPQEASRTLIDLGSNESVLVTQPLGEPRLGADGSSLPWRMRFDLGNKVKVTRSDVLIPLSGSPEITLGEELGISGNIELRPGGRVSIPGVSRPFIIESGTVYFDADGDPSDPRLRITAVCVLPQLRVTAKLSGTFKHLTLRWESDDATLKEPQIVAALLSGDGEADTTTGLSAAGGFLSKQLLKDTAFSSVEIKAGKETTADQRSYQTYSATFPLTDEIWFEGTYKTLQTQSLSGGSTNAFSGTVDWRFRRNWSLRTEFGNLGTGLDLLWQYKY